MDTETTGTNIAKDRIVSLSATKLLPDGTYETRSTLINPECDIPAGSTKVHGITNEDVANAPKFAQIARSFSDFIAGSVLSGYNIADFDVQLLVEEFLRAGIEWPVKDFLIVDSCIIFKKKEERTLSAALKFYTGQELDGAHDAGNDVIASIHVLNAEVQVYPDLAEMSIEELAAYSKYDGNERVDLAGCFVRNEQGTIVYGFGKHKGDGILTSPSSYLSWIINTSDYSQYTKNIATKIKEGKLV